jgi:F-type H+-transporting ATPase subunit alpha
MPVERQVAVIFAVNNGFFDEVAVEDVRDAEKKLVAFLEQSKQPLLDKIAAGEWEKEVEEALMNACKEWRT